MIDDLRLVVIETEAQHSGITSKDANRSVTRITKKSKRRISLHLEESFENYTDHKTGAIIGKSPRSA
jgi:succinylglutamate desuccinylase